MHNWSGLLLTATKRAATHQNICAEKLKNILSMEKKQHTISTYEKKITEHFHIQSSEMYCSWNEEAKNAK